MGIQENHDAQFMLLAGFIIAIGLVITTVTLNSIIFEGNMAIEAVTEPSKMEIVNLMAITQDEVKSTYRSTTAPGGNTANATANFSREVNNFRNNLSQIYAQFGEGVNISLDVSSWNNQQYANFTNSGTASGAANWTVVEGVKNVSLLELRNVSGSNLIVSASDQTNGAFLWSMGLNGNNNISINNASGFVGYYNVNYTYINLLNGSYSFNVSSGSNISRILFANGANASGRFNLTGRTVYNSNFTRARDYTLNATILFATSRVRVNITVPISVPW